MHGMRLSLVLALLVAWTIGPASRAADEPAAAPPPAAAPAPAPVNPPSEDRIVPDPGEVAADALVVRPLGLAATAIGAAIYVVALPFAAIAGDIHTPARALVGAPARYTFKRRLGDFGPRHL